LLAYVISVVAPQSAEDDCGDDRERAKKQESFMQAMNDFERL
jgi:hypothetical protein